jgi:hypothetical protein
MMLQNKGRLGLHIGIVACEIVGKKIPIFKYRLNIPPQKTCFTAELSDACTILLAIGTDHNTWRGRDRGRRHRKYRRLDYF